MEKFNSKLRIEGEIYKELKNVIDPEVALNIVDMGLIYEIEFREPDKINIKMTLSSPGCPLGDVIIQDIKSTLSGAFPEYSSQVELVWEPAWSPEMLTEEGRKALGQ